MNVMCITTDIQLELLIFIAVAALGSNWVSYWWAKRSRIQLVQAE